ncbi:MAG TPA: metallophosphoesterase [Elusimicrobiota bacterium]|jgi:hypothetical protein|nr:metallophosphoesterase [Elusimicrobiota bacterium]
MKSSAIPLLALTVALPLCAGAARAQEYAARVGEIPSAPLSRGWSAAPFVPAVPVLSAALAAPSILPAPAPAPAPAAVLSPAALAPAAPAPLESPSAAPAAAPAAALVSIPAAASAPAPERASPEVSLNGGASFWDGAETERGGSPAGPELEAARRLAEPFRTKTQLARLSRSPRPAGEAYRFAVIGDAEPGRFWIWRALFNRDPGAFWKLLPRADRSGADFIMQLGDMVSRGVPRNFRAFFSLLRARAPRTPYLTVIGNHDRHSPHGVTNSRVYRSMFGATNYAFERGGRRFVVLDNSAGRVTPGQLAWLSSVLSAGKPAVVFTHMPPAPLGEWTDFAGRKGSGGFRGGAEEFMSLMSERKVARVYVGHVHAFGALERGGVRYVLTGGGGSPLFPGPVKERFHHYLTVDDGPDGLVETVHRSDGTSFVLR